MGLRRPAVERVDCGIKASDAADDPDAASDLWVPNGLRLRLTGAVICGASALQSILAGVGGKKVLGLIEEASPLMGAFDPDGNKRPFMQ